MRLSDNLFLRRLHSLAGAVPLGGYLLFHLYANSFALSGPAVYDEHVRPLRELPYLIVIAGGVIFLPLMYHAGYGLYIWYTGQSNILRYGYLRNRLYTKQRVTGLIVLVFVCYHVYDQVFRPDVSFANVAGSLKNPAVLALYVLGVSSAAWHFFMGLWNVFIKWGVTLGEKSQRVTLIVCSTLGIGLVVVGLRAVFAFVDCCCGGCGG